MPTSNVRTKKLIQLSRQLSKGVDQLDFSEPITHVYNPLNYAQKAHEAFIQRFAQQSKKAVFLGMNPGPWGMAQTGVPFGHVGLVKSWMKLDEEVQRPKNEHPKRPIDGFNCKRNEVSGERLWGYFSEKFPAAEDFFKDHYVINYCPLIFMEASGKNRTPDKIPRQESQALFELCDEHLREAIDVLEPEWLIGVGGFAHKKLKSVFKGSSHRIETILHPSPASPIANRGWAQQAEKQLLDMGLFEA